jgi:hypothetical protein
VYAKTRAASAGARLHGEWDGDAERGRCTCTYTGAAVVTMRLDGKGRDGDGGNLIQEYLLEFFAVLAFFVFFM